MKSCCLILFFSIFCFNCSFAGNPTVFDHFYKEDIINLTIETNFKKLKRKKHSSEWWPGKLRWKNHDGINEDLNIEIRSRGNLRREICNYPPLKIKLSKDDTKKLNLTGSRKIKIVSSCRGTAPMEEYVLREHLIYKMYNKLTATSFRVQLVRFTFRDESGKRADRTSFGFLIEDIDDVAERLNEREFEPRVMSYQRLSDKSFDRMSIFQYAIGNTDWYISNQHNLKLISDRKENGVRVIPYDFDFAGLVKTPYSTPSVGIPTESVVIRTFIGECRTDEEWQTNLTPFHSVKNDWFSMIENDKFLSNRSKEMTRKYIQKFYKIIENEKKLKRNLKTQCDRYIKRWD